MQPKSDAILQAFMDSFTFPLWLVDSNHNILMNEYALELSNSGFDIKSKINKMRLGDTKILFIMARNIKFTVKI